MKSSDIFLAYRLTPIALKSRQHDSGVNQYGLKPVNAYDFINPTNLINFGRGTTFDNLGVRRAGRGEIDSSPSLGGSPVFTQAKLVGLSGEEQLVMCQSETMALRVCMARGAGKESCERESHALDTCLSRVGHLRRAMNLACWEFNDWFIQNVSDNHTKPFEHRPHDWRHFYAQEKLVRVRQQNGHAYGRRPKQFSFGARYVKTEGYGKRPRLPYNK
ncbi:hypothetical protein ERJ75_000274100 [Trypanosoma vivax]|uniref:Uncharacterized protein n=1 Tax=Trypanosoma vivax (strain Y486) TaxID=1055687 RepID=G0U5E1_TRYVY|nr:hypothetical protein ERJ75_000274100 [Trypanosoma vivax]CCC51089.1 conserved hypothetical protein [Trypanosoma vivax Y486]